MIIQQGKNIIQIQVLKKAKYIGEFAWSIGTLRRRLRSLMKKYYIKKFNPNCIMSIITHITLSQVTLSYFTAALPKRHQHYFYSCDKTQYYSLEPQDFRKKKKGHFLCSSLGKNNVKGNWSLDLCKLLPQIIFSSNIS